MWWSATESSLVAALDCAGTRLADPEPRQRQPKHLTKRAILTAAKRRLMAEGLPETLNLKVSAALEELGLTTGAAYQIWSNQAEFQRDLLLEIVADFDYADSTSTSISLDEFGADDVEARIRTIANAYLEFFRSRPEFFVALPAWGVKEPSESLRDAVVEGYAKVDDDFVKQFTLFHQVAGKRIKPGFSIYDLMVVVGALTEGLALRGKFDPSALTSNADVPLYGEALMALWNHFTEDDPGEEPADPGALKMPS